MAESLLAALLNVAGNAEGRTFADVVRWVLSTDMPVEDFVGEVPPLIRALKADADPSRKEAGQAFARYVRTNQPLDPPLLIVMDEAAILRPDQLPSWAATLSEIGVQLVTAWQSVSQIEAAYGHHAQGILTNHLSRLFYAGMTDTPGLDYVGRLLGDEHLPARLSDGASRGDGRREESVATVPLVPPAALRRMHPGDALLIHGTLPPAHVRLRPWYRDRRLRQRANPGGF